MLEINQRFEEKDLQANGIYCIVPILANVTEKDSRFLLRVLVEPNGSWRFWTTCKVYEVKNNANSFDKKVDFARSACPNTPNCSRSDNSFNRAHVFNLKCGPEVVTYDTKIWHQQCFRCHKCRKDMNNLPTTWIWKRALFCGNCYVCDFCGTKSPTGYRDNGGSRTCRNCHLKRFAARCTECGRPIEG